MNIWQSYKQERGCRIHFAHLANTLIKDDESARDNGDAENARHEIAEHENAAPECKGGKCET